MKFFIPLGIRVGDGEYASSHMGTVYGPYKDEKTVSKVIASLWPNDEKQQVLVFDGQIVNVESSNKEKPEDEKRAPGNMDNYIKDGEVYKCKDCDTTILDGAVEYPIYANYIPRHKTEVPYCPNCEKKNSLQWCSSLRRINVSSNIII